MSEILRCDLPENRQGTQKPVRCGVRAGLKSDIKNRRSSFMRKAPVTNVFALTLAMALGSAVSAYAQTAQQPPPGGNQTSAPATPSPAPATNPAQNPSPSTPPPTQQSTPSASPPHPSPPHSHQPTAPP